MKRRAAACCGLRPWQEVFESANAAFIEGAHPLQLPPFHGGIDAGGRGLITRVPTPFALVHSFTPSPTSSSSLSLSLFGLNFLCEERLNPVLVTGARECSFVPGDW